MNDIAKQAISEKLRKACEHENVSREKASMLLGLKSKHYGGFIASTSKIQWKNVSAKALEQARDWTNSGESLVNYHQKFVKTEIDVEKKDPPVEHTKKKRDTSWLTKKKQMDQKFAGVKQQPSIGSFELITDQGIKLKMEFEINMVLKLNGQEIQL